MKISEIFPSIDGEVNGFHGQGQPTVFIRFQGCTAKCVYCDTEYAQNLEHGREFTIDEIVEEVKGYKIGKVTITGGEPLEQRDGLIELVNNLVGLRVSIETNGMNEICHFSHPGYVWVLDYKLPSSGLDVPTNLFASNLRKMCPGRDWIKFVVGTVEDFNEAGKIIKDFRLEQFNIAMSPIYGVLKPSMLFLWMLNCETYYHVNCQLHKLIGIK
jgi:7-carboxy-7-deazaguanine synthase